MADVEALSYEAAKRYLKRIKWYLSESYRLWFQSCLPEVLTESAVVLIDISDSSKSWIHEAITALRSLAHNSTGRLNFIQFNGEFQFWYLILIAHFRRTKGLAKSMLCNEPVGPWWSLALASVHQAIRWVKHDRRTQKGLVFVIKFFYSVWVFENHHQAYLYNPKHIVVITDGIFELKPFNVYTVVNLDLIVTWLLLKEITSANEKKQVPLHFILPSQKYKEPGFELLGYKSQQAELGAVVKMLKVVDI